MAKKNAKKEVTANNWPEDAEEAGTFSLASEDVLKNRTIKRAKRRNGQLQTNGRGTARGRKRGGESPGKKPLEGSRTRKNTARATAEPEAALGSVTANGPTPLDHEQVLDPQTYGHSQIPVPPRLAFSQAFAGSVYHRQLTGLNCSVRDWIAKHVNANPFCDLTPVFKQYEKYLAAIEKQFHSSFCFLSESEPNRGLVGTQPASLVTGANLQPELVTPEKTEFMSERKADAPLQGAVSGSASSFGKNTESSVWASFSSGSMNASSSTRNSRLTGKRTTQRKRVSAKALRSPAQGSSDECKGKGDEPPEVVLVEEEEESTFYSKKCKLFYQKDNEFKEKGVGTLYLKSTANQKTRLLVQGTKLGSVLLNILMPPNMPCTRMGKNNILFICEPNPPLDEMNTTIEVTMLIRVRTSKDADELHKILLQKMDA